MKLTRHARHVLSSRGWLSTQPIVVRDALLDIGELRNVPANTVLSEIGTRGGPLMGLVSGWVNVLVAPLTQDPLLVHVGGPGAWGGEAAILTNSERRIDITTRTDCQVALFSEQNLRHLRKTLPEVWDSLIVLVTSHSQHSVVSTVCLAQRDSMVRVCMTLLRLIGDELMFGINDQKDPKELPITQHEIAEMSALSRNSVGSALKKLEKLGAIELGYMSVKVLNRDLLRQKT